MLTGYHTNVLAYKEQAGHYANIFIHINAI